MKLMLSIVPCSDTKSCLRFEMVKSTGGDFFYVSHIEEKKSMFQFLITSLRTANCSNYVYVQFVL